MQHAIAACAGSFAAATATSPIWVVKTRLQLQSDSESLGVGKWGVRSPSQGQARSFSTCASSPLASPMTNRYSRVRNLMVGGSEPTFVATGKRRLASAVAAAVRPAVGALAAARNAGHVGQFRAGIPMHRSMPMSTASTPTVYKGLGDAFRAIYREEGIAGFYRGLTASYLGAAESMIQFALYQQLKQAYLHVKYQGLSVGEAAISAASTTNAGFGSTGTARGSPDGSARPAHEFGGLEAVVLGASAKLVAAATVYPQEVIRTRMREQRGIGAKARYRGVFHCLKTVAREEGMAGLYGGMPAHLMRVVPNAAVLFLVVETMLGGAV